MRYRYESATLEVSAFRAAFDDSDDFDQTETFEGFKIFDSLVGNTEDSWVAFTRDRDMAGTVINLLNANDYTRKEPA